MKWEYHNILLIIGVELQINVYIICYERVFKNASKIKSFPGGGPPDARFQGGYSIPSNFPVG